MGLVHDRSPAYRMAERLATAEKTTLIFLRRYSPTFMRWAIGLVFVWFGALKLAQVSPAAGLVAETLRFLPISPSFTVAALGVFEAAAGIALIANLLPRTVLAAILLHLLGTLFALISQPASVFQHGNPFLLTIEGEFIVKNAVLVAGALVVASSLPPRSSDGGS
ncbi:DoxX family membrane protein [Nonomuraea sp. NPDC050783]|uniref:DoxX family membrane protein n=1 Tax=Nonomuraea sp. NPDC050783 TaxID=3154634 RepID=UPI0034678CB4